MGYLDELSIFYKHIEKCHERQLGKKELAKEFVDFMHAEYGYTEDYYKHEYHDNNHKY